VSLVAAQLSQHKAEGLDSDNGVMPPVRAFRPEQLAGVMTNRAAVLLTSYTFYLKQ
jgi:hypothetical protein